MSDEKIDPRIDRMMAALYGELTESEERAFRRLLEKDDRLRVEFEELKETRRLLGGWEVEERVPSFVLIDGEGERAAGRPAAIGSGWLERVRGALRGLGATPAWGLATAAVVLLVLAIAGFRIESIDGGIAFRFGEPPRPRPRSSRSTGFLRADRSRAWRRIGKPGRPPDGERGVRLCPSTPRALS
jgi:anti-sigma factor RsiW